MPAPTLLDNLSMGDDFVFNLVVLLPTIGVLPLVLLLPLDRQMTQTKSAPTAPAVNISYYIKI
jgi:hypothetical protein